MQSASDMARKLPSLDLVQRESQWFFGWYCREPYIQPNSISTQYCFPHTHKSRSIDYVMCGVCPLQSSSCGPERCQSGPALTFSVLCLCLHWTGHLRARVVTQIVCSVRSACMRVTTFTLGIQNLTLSEMITPQTYKYNILYIKNCFLSLVYSGLAQARPE